MHNNCKGRLRAKLDYFFMSAAMEKRLESFVINYSVTTSLTNLTLF